ncbi:MAG: nucleotidyltransferase [Vagococcus sp.]|uniref:nucleotidyltransferase n=1 Tax=Vagococcus sp. TaxID=1933889 RepID=UPI002FCC6FBB
MDKSNILDKIYRELAESLNISKTMSDEVVSSYEAVGNYLGKMEKDMDIRIFPQGSLSLGTVVKPIENDVEGDYDVDLVCLLENGSSLLAKDIKNIVGNRLKESDRYNKMLDEEGKRCWTLQYSKFHMDILPSVPLNSKITSDKNNLDTKIRITHKNESNEYLDKNSDPKSYREWFIKEMEQSFKKNRQFLAESRDVEIEKIKLSQVRTPLQMAIQILKRHRDVLFTGCDDKPISIIITTLAAKAYNGEENLFEAIQNILENMEKFIEIDGTGSVIICNPTMKSENFADKWIEEPSKKDAFYTWLSKAKEDIVENPLNFTDGMGAMKNNMRTIFGTRAVNESFDNYNINNINDRENGKLGVTNKGNIALINEKSVVAPLKSHTFYGK